MAILPESGPSAIVPSLYFLITPHYLGCFLFTISQQKNTSSRREDACLSFTPTPQIGKWAWHRQALKKGFLNRAIWSESSLNRSPGIRTERICGADKDSSFQVCASQPSVPSSSSSSIPDPQPPHSPAPRPSPRSRGAGRLLSPSGRNSNSRNSWPNLPLCPT